MLFTLVAVSLSTSFGSITTEAHPGTRLLAASDVPASYSEPLRSSGDLERELASLRAEPSPFVLPSIFLGVSVVGGAVGVLVAIFAVGGYAGLFIGLIIAAACAALLVTSIILFIVGGVKQARRSQRIDELKHQLELQRLREELAPPPPPPPVPGVQNVPVVTPRLVLARF